MPTDKGHGIVVIDFSVYNQKLMDLLDDNNTYEQIFQESILKNVNDFHKSYKKLVSKENKYWFSLINSHFTIHKIDSLVKTHKPDIPSSPIISGRGFAPYLLHHCKAFS